MPISDNIKKWRLKKELSQTELAKIIGVTDKAISTWENGTREPRMGTIQKLADFFGIPKSTLIEDSVSDLTPSPHNIVRSVRIPVLGTIVAGIPMEAVENIIDYEDIPIDMANGYEYFALRVKGRSMEPKFLEGDTVIVQKASTVDSGEIAIVLINGYEATMKKVQRSPAGVTLIAYNPDVYEPHFYSNEDIMNLPVQVIGRVVEIRRKV